MLSIDSGVDVNGTGTVDFRTPGDYSYESYTRISPLKNSRRQQRADNTHYSGDRPPQKTTTLSEVSLPGRLSRFRHRDAGDRRFFGPITRRRSTSIACRPVSAALEFAEIGRRQDRQS